MHVKKGYNRIVLIFPRLKIVIKFPVINLLEAFQPIFMGKAEGIKSRELVKEHFQLPVSSKNSFKSLLFRGLLANWNEFRFYRKTKNPFLRPTYFSLLGFMNIQKYGRQCQLFHIDFWCQLYELTDAKVQADAHHFAEPHNFCFEDKLQMFDYGSARTHSVILEYGERIVKNFNPAYCWEVEKWKLKDPDGN